MAVRDLRGVSGICNSRSSRSDGSGLPRLRSGFSFRVVGTFTSYGEGVESVGRRCI